MMDQYLIEIGRQVYLTENGAIGLTELNIHLRKFTTDQVKIMIARNLQQVERIESKIGKSKDIEEEVFLLSNSTEFAQEDVPMLRTNPEQVIEKYYSGAVVLLMAYGVDLQALFDNKDLWNIDDISRAERILGWEPTFTFRGFYENLKADRYSRDYMFIEETSVQ